MNVLTTLIPIYQPGGRLSVPQDDWAALNRLVESRFGGHIHVRETRKSGYLVVGGTGRGLPCLELLIEVPEDINPKDVANGEFDESLRQTITRNIDALHEPQAA